MGIFAWSVLTEPPAAQNAYLVFFPLPFRIAFFLNLPEVNNAMVVDVCIDVCCI